MIILTVTPTAHLSFPPPQPTATLVFTIYVVPRLS